MKQRSINIDLIKCIAVFFVIAVHFFLNTDFYSRPLIENHDNILIFMRSIFIICVPLFLITTGYLMKNKTISKKYYSGLLRVLTIYALSVLSYSLYDIFYLKNNSFSIIYILKNILSFDIGYSWYVEMYVGLFFLIPFLNLLYNNIKSRKEKNILLITLIFVTSLPAITNISFDILPNWWCDFYPVTYYFIGCYLRDYKISIGVVKNIILIILSLLLATVINIIIVRSTDNIFLWGIHCKYYSILVFLPSVLTFIFILNLNFNSLNKNIKKIIIKVSQLSFGIYLTSAIVDDFLYRNYYKIDICCLTNFLKIVPLSFALSTSLSMILDFAYRIINRGIKK